MRLGMAAAALTSALLFAASQTAHAMPTVNLKGAAQSPSGLVELARSPGSGRGGGPGIRAGGGGSKMGARYSVPRSSAGKVYGGKGPGKAYRGYAGKGPGKVYGGKGPGKYGGYAYKGGKDHGKRYSRRFYPYFWPGIAASGAYSYADDCGSLRRRAQATGSIYWWQRYQECRYYAY